MNQKQILKPDYTKKSKGSEAKLCYMGHVLMENRNGLAVGALVTLATGTEEREAALELINESGGSHRITLGADKGYDAEDFAKKITENECYPTYSSS